LPIPDMDLQSKRMGRLNQIQVLLNWSYLGCLPSKTKDSVGVALVKLVEVHMLVFGPVKVEELIAATVKCLEDSTAASKTPLCLICEKERLPVNAHDMLNKDLHASG
jgi:hypothetical protein